MSHPQLQGYIPADCHLWLGARSQRPWLLCLPWGTACCSRCSRIVPQGYGTLQMIHQWSGLPEGYGIREPTVGTACACFQVAQAWSHGFSSRTQSSRGGQCLASQLLQAWTLEVPGADEWTEGEAGGQSCPWAVPEPALGLHSWSKASQEMEERRVLKTVASPLCSSEPWRCQHSEGVGCEGGPWTLAMQWLEGPRSHGSRRNQPGSDKISLGLKGG